MVEEKVQRSIKIPLLDFEQAEKNGRKSFASSCPQPAEKNQNRTRPRHDACQTTTREPLWVWVLVPFITSTSDNFDTGVFPKLILTFQDPNAFKYPCESERNLKGNITFFPSTFIFRYFELNLKMYCNMQVILGQP